MRSDSSRLRDIANYYLETRFDYQLAWTHRPVFALHLGYWDETTRNHAGAQINGNRQMAIRADLQPGQLVLDAGCGVGGTAVWLAENYGVRVTGITIVHDQAARARRWANRRGRQDTVSVSLQDYLETAFPENTFDAVVAMYHDQGLAPFKLIAFDNGVNLTLGLPFVRTSPDHGTAPDIAGKGIARPDGSRDRRSAIIRPSTYILLRSAQTRSPATARSSAAVSRGPTSVPPRSRVTPPTCSSP